MNEVGERLALVPGCFKRRQEIDLMAKFICAYRGRDKDLG